MMNAPTTPAQIDAQIGAIDVQINALEEHASSLALAAVDGVAGAGAEIVKVRAELDAIRADREILSIARRAAVDRAEAQDAAVDDATRAAHLADAQAAAGRLLAVADRIDALVAGYADAVADLSREQAAVRSAMRLAGQLSVSDARVGRSGAESHARFLVQNVADGRGLAVANSKTMRALIVAAWGEILENSDVKS